MTIYIDADSCPVKVREIICKAAMRRHIPALFVGARSIPLPRGEYINLEVVEVGPDSADKSIFHRAEKGDLVVTRDIPFAADLVAKGVSVINDRGTHYNRENVRSRLSERDFMTELRSMGLPSHRARSMGSRDIQAFAATFDRILTNLSAATGRCQQRH